MLKHIRDKRAISGVVVTILLILLALVAILIIWGVVRPLLLKTSSKISAECLEIDLTASAEYDASAGEITVKVSRGEGPDISTIRILVDETNKTDVSASELTEYDIETYGPYAGYTSKPSKVEIIPILITDGQENKCNSINAPITIATA